MSKESADAKVSDYRGWAALTALQVGRRLGAIIPLTILALTVLIVSLLTVSVPTRARREATVHLMYQLTRFAAVVAGRPEAVAREAAAAD